MIPSIVDYYLPVLQELAASPVPLSRKEIGIRTADRLQISLEERRELTKTGVPVFLNRPGWAISYLSQAKYIVAVKRGYFSLSDEGKAILNEKPTSLTEKDLLRSPAYAEWKEKLRLSAKEKANSTAEETTLVAFTNSEASISPDELLDTAYTQLTQKLQQDIKEALLNLESYAFEQVCTDLLSRLFGSPGNEARGITTPRSKDGGIDGIIYRDPLGLDNIYIQAKKYDHNSKVSRPMVQAFKGALQDHGAKAGVFITTSSFTLEAMESARQGSISLIDGDKLAQLMIDYGLGCSVRKTIQLKALDNDYFDNLVG